eukprot:363171-Chlamydomonas_euryale.AAC.15
MLLDTWEDTTEPPAERGLAALGAEGNQASAAVLPPGRGQAALRVLGQPGRLRAARLQGELPSASAQKSRWCTSSHTPGQGHNLMTLPGSGEVSEPSFLGMGLNVKDYLRLEDLARHCQRAWRCLASKLHEVEAVPQAQHETSWAVCPGLSCNSMCLQVQTECHSLYPAAPLPSCSKSFVPFCYTVPCLCHVPFPKRRQPAWVALISCRVCGAQRLLAFPSVKHQLPAVHVAAVDPHLFYCVVFRTEAVESCCCLA